MTHNRRLSRVAGDRFLRRQVANYLGMLLGLIVSGVSGLALAAPITFSGLTHQYAFDDGTGTAAVDSAGNVNATLRNFPAGNLQWIPGMFGRAVNFTNANSYVITDAAIPTDLFSVSFWMLSTGAPNNLSSNLLSPQGDNWIHFDHGLGVGINVIRDNVRPKTGIWENYVVTVDRAAGAISVYRDGALRASGVLNMPILDNKRWVFGHNSDVSNTNGSFTGALDEIQFYNRILSSSEASELASRPPQPGITSRLVALAANFPSPPRGQYATASSTMFLDPATIDWVAWNRFPDLRTVADPTTGKLNLGMYRPEVDDFFNLTVTNPLGQSLTVALDQNDGIGKPIGQQSVIFGTAAAAPDVSRGDNFSTPFFFDEAGAFNSIFTAAGNYKFDFSFQNSGGDANYPDVYLLAHTIPEPSAFLLLALGAACGVVYHRRLRRT